MPSKLKRLEFRCTDEEQEKIFLMARDAGLSVSKFLHAVFLKTHIPTKSDTLLRHELRQVNADIARLGGLLKMALSHGDREKTQHLIDELAKLQLLLKSKISSL